MKRPAFQFYPADWRKDPALSLCSIAAHGLWINLLCVAHESDEYGHLVVNGCAMSDVQLARAVGESPALVGRLVAELEAAGVFSRDDQGAIFCRRMERDERQRQAWAASQRKHRGTDPNVMPMSGRSQADVSPDVSTMSRLSSSSSSSSSSKARERGVCPNPSDSDLSTLRKKKTNGKGNGQGERLRDDWILPDKWLQWTVQKPDWNEDRAMRESLVFKDYWHAKAGVDARKVDWYCVWRNWVRRAR